MKKTSSEHRESYGINVRDLPNDLAEFLFFQMTDFSAA